MQIGITLASERDLRVLLERILGEGRRFTHAEAGTLFLREGDFLHFAVVQNDRLARELGEEEMKRLLQEEPLHLRELSLAGHVAQTGDILNLHDTYMIPPDRPYGFDARVDARTNYRTQSILVVPLQDAGGNVLGVLELINALDRGRVVPFDSQYESLVRALASQAAVAIRNARLEDLSFKDALTDVYNRHSRSFSVVTRYGGDEFAIILVNTTKAGAITYGERIRAVLEQHTFEHGTTTVSLGIASLPDDGVSADDLIVAADRALYDAKRLGRNRVSA